MNISFTNGTAQQRQWVMDAIARCTLPLDQLAANVTVTWGPFPANLDTRHPYMATQPANETNYTVYIAPWADDPSNPNMQGLKDPSSETRFFYMESFVHELGHVWTDSSFDPAGADTDPRIDQVCALFWRNDPSGKGTAKRYGTRGDWDDPKLSWPDEIREAVAEWIRLAFYTDITIYGNRSNWWIDESNWQAFLGLLAIGTSGGAPSPATDAKTSVEFSKFTSANAFTTGLPAGFPASPPGFVLGKLQNPGLALTLFDNNGLSAVTAGIETWELVADVGFDETFYAAAFVDVITDSVPAGRIYTDGSSASLPLYAFLEFDYANGIATAKLTSDSAGTIVVIQQSQALSEPSGLTFTKLSFGVDSASEIDVNAFWDFNALHQSPPNFLHEPFNDASILSDPDILSSGTDIFSFGGGTLKVISSGVAQTSTIQTKVPTEGGGQIPVDGPYPVALFGGSINVGQPLRGALRELTRLHGRLQPKTAVAQGQLATPAAQDPRTRGASSGPGLRGAVRRPRK